jgi:hypothetical protein
MKDEHLSVAENAAAISDQVHSQPAPYRELYDRLANKLSGFTGIWTLIAECAVELEKQHPQEWDGQWIETCWAIGDFILLLEEPAAARDLVSRALSQNSPEGPPS